MPAPLIGSENRPDCEAGGVVGGSVGGGSVGGGVEPVPPLAVVLKNQSDCILRLEGDTPSSVVISY
jgi:hypothetical protein